MSWLQKLLPPKIKRAEGAIDQVGARRVDVFELRDVQDRVVWDLGIPQLFLDVGHGPDSPVACDEKDLPPLGRGFHLKSC